MYSIRPSQGQLRPRFQGAPMYLLGSDRGDWGGVETMMVGQSKAFCLPLVRKANIQRRLRKKGQKQSHTRAPVNTEDRKLECLAILLCLKRRPLRQGNYQAANDRNWEPGRGTKAHSLNRYLLCTRCSLIIHSSK